MVDLTIDERATAALEEFIRAKEQAWLDEPVPALAGLTPRQAAGDPTRREDLVTLLRDFEQMPRPGPGAIGFDAVRLRTALGLSDPDDEA